MTSPRYVRLRSVSRNEDKWTVEFDTRADCIGDNAITVSIDAIDKDKAERPLEDCIRRCRKQVAMGLAVAAQLAMDALSDEDKEDIRKNLPGVLQNPALLSAPRRPFDV